ncbi:MAG TPA: hypothetical protein VKT75_00900 [Acidobacteriaceae bacterium]|nr:hypothetical protein [Acidobacteriaceae bacterium]
MKHPAVAALAAVVIAAGQKAATSFTGPAAAEVERVESGTLQTPDGRRVVYRIRLLPVASFPDLPPEVASVLDRIGCMIPQTFEAQQPENVIEGAFRAPASRDWAALCSVHGRTTLYVFFDGHYNSPEPLRSQADTLWLGAEPGSSVYGSAWGIAVRGVADLRQNRQWHGAAHFDHDAIEDARLERSTSLHYWQMGEWLPFGVNEQGP